MGGLGWEKPKKMTTQQQQSTWLKAQLESKKQQADQQKRYKGSMVTPFSIGTIMGAINGIKKTNDYILDNKVRNQVDLVEKHLIILQKKGVTSIDGLTFMKTRQPKKVNRFNAHPNVNTDKPVGWPVGGIGTAVFNPPTTPTTPRPPRNIRNLTVNTQTVGMASSNFSNWAGLEAISTPGMTEMLVEYQYDISDDAVDYVFDAAEKYQTKLQITPKMPTLQNAEKTDKIIAEAEKAEEKVIANAVSPSKFNMNYVYIAGGVLATLVALKFIFGGKGAKVIS